MAVTNIPIDRTKTYGQLLSNHLSNLQQCINNHIALRLKMISDGYDDSSGADGSAFGFGTITQAHNAFLQMDTVYNDVFTGANLAALQQLIQQVG